MKGSSPETHRAEMKGPVLLFLECEILRDGTYSQFTQLGSFVDLNGAAFTPTSSTSTNTYTYTFQANIIVKHKSLYDHYKQSQDMTSLLNQGRKPWNFFFLVFMLLDYLESSHSFMLTILYINFMVEKRR